MLTYHAFIEVNLNYGSLIWMNRNKPDMKHIENVQKRALRMVIGSFLNELKHYTRNKMEEATGN